MIPVPPTVLTALAARYATTSAQLNHFGGGREDSDGIVYIYPLSEADSKTATHRLLKIMAFPQDKKARSLFCLEERLRFMKYLGEKGARVVYPLPSPNGNLYETYHEGAWGWVGYSMDIAPGKPLARNAWHPDFIQQWGQTIGLCHRLATEYPSWESSIEPETGQPVLNWREEWSSFVEMAPDNEIKQKWLYIGQRLEYLPCTRTNFGFIHNDPHIQNLLYDGEKITLLDFDVANHHWFMMDLAVACQSILFSHSGGMERPLRNRSWLLDFYRLFSIGYEREYHLNTDWLEQVELFIAYRRLLLYTVMQGWLQTQPKLQASWKRMIISPPILIGQRL